MGCSSNNNNKPNINKMNKTFFNNFHKSPFICGIKNLGNNCYMNSGLQILASCQELVKLIKNYRIRKNNIISELKNAFDYLLNKNIYNPDTFIKYFCSINIDFIRGSQCCSQNFIRTLIKNINDIYLSDGIEIVSENKEYQPSNKEEKKQYKNFILSNKVFPESEVMSIFSGITKSHSSEKCLCGYKFDEYSFNYFIDQIIYLDVIYKDSKFSEVLKVNLRDNILTIDCPKCKRENKIKQENKIVKLPKILIFTLERYQNNRKSVNIKPDDIDMKEFIDKSLKTDETKYELFAVNIRLGRNVNFGHEICQVKRGDKWYEINDNDGYEIDVLSHFDCSYGLFYRKNENNKKNNEKNIKDNTEKINYLKTNNIENKNQNLKCALEIISSFKELIEYLDTQNKIPDVSSKIMNVIKNNFMDEKDEFLNLMNNFRDINSTQDYIISLIKTMTEEFINEKKKT